jgi:hypothetical protein
MTEQELIITAQNHLDDTVANQAMAELRERFDPTYFWCEDCDGLVCKLSECCLNQNK